MTQLILQNDPLAVNRECREALDAVWRRVVERGRYILDREVEGFEHDFAAYIGSGHAVGVASGTDALYLALLASGVGVGDDVITVAHTSVATVAAIERCGARAVFADVDPVTLTMDPPRIEEVLTPRTKAVVPVHLYGLPADMPAIMRYARALGLRVIEDCAQAHGAGCWVGDAGSWRNVGAWGDAAAFSFYPTKNLGALGDAGCVITNDGEIAERVKRAREFGWRNRFVSEARGWNSRLDELQAAVLRVKLPYLDAWNARRKRIAEHYQSCLSRGDIGLPFQPHDRTHVFHQYVIQSPRRDAIRRVMDAAGIGSAIHYPVPIHLQPAYASTYAGWQLPVTEQLAREVLSLPMYPQLPEAAVDCVCEQVVRAVSKTGR